jgi:hypothetical protein
VAVVGEEQVQLEVLSCLMTHPASIHNYWEFQLPALDRQRCLEVRDLSVHRSPALTPLHDSSESQPREHRDLEGVLRFPA